MKKLMMIFMAAFVALALVGCGMNKNRDNNNHAIKNNAVEDGVTNDNTNNDNNNDNAADNNGESRIDVAEDAADKVAELDEVDSATVLVTDNNAYVAVVLNNNDDATANDNNNDDNANADTNANTNTENELSKDLEDKIADKVREAKPDAKNVYVSLSPDFVERMNTYRTRINEGEPVEGFFEEFSQAVRNVFPNAR